MKKESVPIPHWDPIWSREYALDRLLEYHRRGIPIHSSKLAENDMSLMLAVTRYAGGWREAVMAVGLDPEELTRLAYLQLRHYPDKKSVVEDIRHRMQQGLSIFHGTIVGQKGHSQSHPALVFRGIDYFGSWPNALRAAGFDPAAMFKKRSEQRRVYKSKADVRKAIRQRAARKLPINHGAVSKGPHSDEVLTQWAREYFGSWNAALRAAGFDPIAVHHDVLQKNRRYPDKAALLAAIRQRRDKRRPLNHTAIIKGARRDIPLLDWAKRYCGSWSNALRAAGIEPETVALISPRRKYPTGTDVLKAIRERAKREFPINHGAVAHGPHADCALINWARKHFGSWPNALQAAGFDPEKFTRESHQRSRQYPDPAAVLAALQQRQREGQPLNYASAVRGRFRDAALCLAVKRHFGSWDNALRAAGIDPDEVSAEMFRKFQRYPDKQAVLAAIQQRQKKGQPLNHAGAVKGRFGDRALYLAVKRHFDSWDNALRAAGIDPIAVRAEALRRYWRKPNETSASTPPRCDS